MLENVDPQAPLQATLNEKFKAEGEVVDLSGQDFSDWVSIQSLCARLGRSDNGKSAIHLDNCSLGRHGAAIVARSFTHVLIRAGNFHAQWLPLMFQNSRIKVLSMANNKLGPDGAAAVAKMLRVNIGLRDLNLKYNSIRSEGTQYLASALCVNSGLSSLSLCGNELCGIDEYGDGEYDLSGIMALTNTLQVNQHLKTLKLSENDIGDEGVRYLGEALKVNTTLTTLDIHGNCLFHNLESCITDYDKDLSLNPLSISSTSTSTSNSTSTKKSSSTSTSTTLPSPPPLYGTTSSGNPDISPSPTSNPPATATATATSVPLLLPTHMTSTGAYSFFDALLTNVGLLYVDLSWNELGPIAAGLIGSVLSLNSTIRSLHLGGNPLGDVGIQRISQGIRANPTCSLLALNLELCCIGIEGAKAVAELISHNN
eukprot:gene3011-5900_t